MSWGFGWGFGRRFLHHLWHPGHTGLRRLWRDHDGHIIYADLLPGATPGEATIRYGRRRMPSYQRIPESDRWDIVNYVRYLGGKTGVAAR